MDERNGETSVEKGRRWVTETEAGSTQGVPHRVYRLERRGGRNKVLLSRLSEWFGSGCLRMTPENIQGNSEGTVEGQAPSLNRRGVEFGVQPSQPSDGREGTLQSNLSGCREISTSLGPEM